MRTIGTKAQGIRLPIIGPGDDLAQIVADSVLLAAKTEGITFQTSDVIGVTESIVAKAQGNFATLDHIATDIARKFPQGEVGLVFPIFSRNRFINILKGIALGAKKVYVLLQYPTDEVGNPIMDTSRIDEIDDAFENEKLITAKRFLEINQGFTHPFTGIDYMKLYDQVGDHVEVYLSKDPREILKLTKHVLVGEIHSRFVTQKRLLKAGAETVYTLSDILNEPVDGSGYNAQYGVLGSNISTDKALKLFPRDCQPFVEKVQSIMEEKTGVKLEVLVYGDGAFKDPMCGIWELADPVVSPGFTQRLGGQPNEIKLKYVVDNELADLSPEEKQKALAEKIKAKNSGVNNYNDGTTPRKYADLLGSLCDLTSGSGDKGTPVILIQGYFDDYTAE